MGLEEAIPFYGVVRPTLKQIDDLGVPSIIETIGDTLTNVETPVDDVIKNLGEGEIY